MGRRKVKFCVKCGEKTVHEYICKETVGDNTGICRVIFALASMGISEIFGATRYWKCSCCGKLTKE